MAGSTKACLFCGRTGQKLTAEDVYPRWLRKALNIKGPITFESDSGVQRSAPTLEVRLREVCEGCNNGWLHDLERAFRSVMVLPMNGFGPLAMPPPVQLVVALWATKTWLLIERSLAYMRGEFPAYVGPEVFRWLRDKSEPPPAMQIWIGAIGRDSAMAAKRLSFVGTHWVVPDEESPPVGIVGIFSIGCVVFFLYAPIGNGPLPPPTSYFAFGFQGLKATFFREIWPHKVAEVQWPPPSIFTVEELQTTWPSGSRIIAATKHVAEQPPPPA